MALIFASEIGDLEQVKSLVLSCEDRAPPVASQSPSSAVRTFEQAKIELVNTTEPKRGRTALIAAVSQGHSAVADFLLSVGANPSMQNNEGLDALMLACQLHGKVSNHSDIVQLLLRHGAVTENVDKKLQTALHYASKKGCHGAVKLILNHDKPLVVDAVDSQGMTSLMNACARGFLLIVNSLCGAGVDTNIQDKTGRTALHWAARSGKRALADVLITHDAKLDVHDSHGLTSLKIASALGKVEFVQELLLRGARVEAWEPWVPTQPNNSSLSSETIAPNITGEQMKVIQNPRSALILAAANGHIETLNLLVSHRLASTDLEELKTRTLLLEFMEADRQAVLSCYDDVHRFLSSLGYVQQFQTLQENDAELLATVKSIRFRRRCACGICKAFYDETGTPTPSVGTAPGAVESDGTSCGFDKAAELMRKSSASLPNVFDGVDGGASTDENGNSKLELSDLVPLEDDKLKRQNINHRSKEDDHRSADGPSEQPQDEIEEEVDDDNVDDDRGSIRSRERRRRKERDGFSRRRERRYDPEKVLDSKDPAVRNDILRIIGTYLQDEGFMAAALTLQDEAQIKLQRRGEMHDKAKHMYELIERGEWSSISAKAVKSLLGRNHRKFLYELHKQEYLELISRGENERAFAYLHKKIKPLEAQCRAHGHKNEFADLCYLLTCKSVHDAQSFRSWDQTSARDQLAEDFKSMVTAEYMYNAEPALVARDRQGFVEKDRLLHLLSQAIAYQLEFANVQTTKGVTPKVDTLLEDFQCVAFPQTLANTFVGHAYSVKCVTFLGEEGRLIASGSSDRNILLWRVQEDIGGADSGSDEDDDDEIADIMDTKLLSSRGRSRSARRARSTSRGSEPSRSIGRSSHDDSNKVVSFIDEEDRIRHIKQRGPELVISGHKSRVWDVDSDRSGRWLLSASGDNTVRVWDVWSCLEQGEEVESSLENSTLVRTQHEGDIYTVRFRNHDQDYIATAGYDKTVRLVNIKTNQLVKTFHGHHAAVTDVKFNPLGNLVISVSKDSTIKFWDTISGACIRSFYQPVGEVTSLDVSRDGLQVLTGSKDNSVRLWDVRSGKPIRRFKGYQNSSLNFVRAVFGPREALVFSGSECGKVHVWDTLTGNLLAKLRGHTGPVFHIAWNSSQSLLASCSQDGTVRTWKP